MTSAGPLSGLRVIEVGHYLAGPFVGTLFAGFGADVIKVEEPARGDFMRHIGEPVGGTSVWFAVENGGKRSLALDLRRPEGLEVFVDLIRISDVLVENFRPSTLEGWGLGPERLWEENSSLIVVRVSGFGQDGPYRARPGYDGLAIAFSGLLSLIGYPDLPDLPPPRPGIVVADYVAPLFAAFGTMVALRAREADPGQRGQVVDMALYEAPLRLLAYHIARYYRTGELPQREGPYSPGAVPGGCYRCRDGGFIIVRVLDERQWHAFCAVIGMREWARDERYRTLEARMERRWEVEEATAAWAAQMEAAEAEKAMLAAGVVCGKVNTMADVCSDPHVKARGDLVIVDDPELGPLAVPAPVPRLTRTPGHARLAPRLGQHTEQVLKEVLGYDDERIHRLRRLQVIP